MALEIERKFLVSPEKLSEIRLTDGEKISQGYLSTDIEKTVRVRIKKNRGFLSVKTKNIGIVRNEFEYENHVWEVDIFEGKLAGLILAEVEINSPDESVKIPSWADKEVSDDPKYYNVNLIFEEFTAENKMS